MSRMWWGNAVRPLNPYGKRSKSARQAFVPASSSSQALVRTAISFTQALDRLTHPEKSFPTEPEGYGNRCLWA